MHLNPAGIQVERNNATGEILVAIPVTGPHKEKVFLLVINRSLFVVTPPLP